MNLPSIAGMTSEDVKAATQIKEQLLKRFECKTLRAVGRHIFDEFKVQTGITMHKYSGTIKPDVVISELELSMVLDDGFNYFGGHSTILPDRTFTATIYVD